MTGTLETTLKDCQDDLEYRVVAGPVASDVFRLTVLHPLVLQNFHAQIEPPSYTRQKPSVVEQTVGDNGGDPGFQGDRGLAGPPAVQLDRAPQTAELRLTPVAEDSSSPAATEILPLTLAESDSALNWDLAAVARELQAELRAKAADGMELEPHKFRIRVQADRKPTIRFVRPDEQLEVTPSTEIPMEVASSDDFGLSQVGIVYQIGNGPKTTLQLDKVAEQPVTLATLATLVLGRASGHVPGCGQLLRLCRGQLSGRSPSRDDRPAVHRHPALQTLVSGPQDRRHVRGQVGSSGRADHPAACQPEPHVRLLASVKTR